ncbi:MAG TPA: YeeE/YedE family protein [Microvirga sp.]|nr:YeeE/YedE family protein [Microvirga sp.]
METFTPVSALLGGILIGLASTLLLWLNGRIAGISGIAGGLLSPAPGEVAWRALFLIGLVLGAGAYGVLRPVTVAIDAPLPLLIAGGLLVGFGTQLGKGCTSGHGVCGIARLSPRSMIATLVFMISAGVTVYVVRHVVGVQP